MEQKAKKGQICTFSTKADMSAMTKKYRATYHQMLRIKAPYYLVLRRNDDESALCVPLTTSEIKFSYAIKINGIKYSAEYLTFFLAKDEWLEFCKVKVGNTYHAVDQIYNLRKRHTKAAINWNRKKKRIKRETDRLMQGLRECRQPSYPKEKVSSSVSWKMAHPAQGGRTSPK